jgi:hypothetical protein
VDQLGSGGTFNSQTGTTSPVNGLPVQTSALGHARGHDRRARPGAHVLYQDITIPAVVPGAVIGFSYFVNNTATAFTTPATLDFSTPALNQQARVDLMSTAADPFSVAPADIFQNLFQTAVGSALVTGYNAFSIDVTAAFAAHAGQTIRLRFAETDNVNIFNFGVDGVTANVPAPGGVLALCPVLRWGRRRR